MEDYELPKLIRQIIREELAPILMGKIIQTDTKYRATAQRFSGENQIKNLRSLHPFGVASKPKPGTECVVLPIMNDPTHLNVLTHHDSGRPEIDEGEICLYGADGQLIYLKNGGSIHQGSKEADEPVVLGAVLKTLLEAILDAVLQAPQIGTCAVGPVVLDPSIRTQLTQAKQTYLATASSNILSQKNFVERGD
jgi:phage gp45-like